MIAFAEQGHRYFGISDTNKHIKWTSATGFIKAFSQDFDKMGTAIKVCQKKGSKWYGLRPNEIIDIWDAESKRSTDIGTVVHSMMESKFLRMGKMKLWGKELEVFAPMYNTEGHKISFNQSLYDGVHPEYMIYRQLDDEVGLCGQSDVVAFCDNRVHISDFKTNKEIKMVNPWAKMKYPFDSMDDCDWNKYTIQLNLYQYLCLLNNPDAQPGELKINHVELELDGYDKYGFPLVTIKDGFPIIKKITKMEVPRLDPELMSEAIREWRELLLVV